MLRRVSPFLVTLLLFGTIACSKRDDTAADQEPADEAVAQQEAGANNEEAPAKERTMPQALEARKVKEVEGVLTKTTLDDGEALRATWGTCALEGELAQIDGQPRSPLRRVLKHQDHLFVLSEYDGNASEVRAFRLEREKDHCVITPWKEFAQNGTLDLGVGIVDFSVVGDQLVTTGIDTKIYNLEGKEVAQCENFQRMTRVRANQGANDVIFRKGGEEVIHATIQEGVCTQKASHTLEGEEALGMRIVPTGPQSLFATLQVDRVPNALAYIEDGKVVWRYFPGDEEPKERIALITELAPLGKDLVAVRSLQKTFDVITKAGERRAKIDMNAHEELDRMAFPDKVVAIDDHTLLVVLRHHVTADEVEKLSLQTLTFAPANQDD